jgi:hypothetical protein
VTHDLLRARAGLLAVALAGCSQQGLDATGVRIDIVTDDPALRPQLYQLAWLDEERRLMTVKVPEEGRLSEDPTATASVFIQLEPKAAGSRRVVARGIRDGALVSVGAERVQAEAGKWVPVLVVTSAPGKLSDADRDDIPDFIDNCPTDPDPCPRVDARDGGVKDAAEAADVADAAEPDGDVVNATARTDVRPD